MQVQKISLGRQYSLQTKKGEPISNEDADRVVKRNMILANAVGISAIGSLALLLTKLTGRKINNLKGNILVLAALGGVSAWLGYGDYKYYHSQKDKSPERFYKWGGFKVSYKA